MKRQQDMTIEQGKQHLPWHYAAKEGGCGEELRHSLVGQEKERGKDQNIKPIWVPVVRIHVRHVCIKDKIIQTRKLLA